MHYRRFVIMTLLLLTALPMALTAQQVSAQGEDPLAGTTVEVIGGIEPLMAEGRMLVLLKITMEPGAEIDAHSHPGAVVIMVDSGVFETTFIHGEGVVTRASTDGTPGATEQAATDVEIVMNPGDSLAYDQTAGHTMVNGSDEPLVLLVSALLASDEQGFLFEDHGTPAAK
jgi:mannose-6-phosphate isomerase-like protein (cupin superfamily)